MQLTDKQLEAVHETKRNLQIIACAGSGKTEVISRRIAEILKNEPRTDPASIVAFTFTNKAADALRRRISVALGESRAQDAARMDIGTIHSFCWRLLQTHCEQFRTFRVLDSVKSHLFITRYCSECGMKTLGLEAYPRNVLLFLSCIEKMIADAGHADAWTREQREAFEQYRSCLYSHGYLDYSFLLYEALRQTEENPAVQDYLRRIRYLVVDEYQDVDDLQEQLIRKISEAGANICVVGDDDQTIYQFRGSSAENMITFSERYADVHQVKLEKNFRSAPQIVDVARTVISNNSRRIPKSMQAEGESADAEVCAHCFENKPEEYRVIAEEIVRLHDKGLPFRQIAILARKGKIIAPIAHALAETQIPVETDSAERFFAGNYFSRFSGTLEVLIQPDHAKLAGLWQDVLDRAAITAGFRYLRGCMFGGPRRLDSIFLEFCEKTGFLRDAEDLEQRRESLNGFMRILSDYEEIYGDWKLSARCSGAQRFIAMRAAEEYRYHSFETNKKRIDAVQLMTVHKAKGLEFDAVFLPELMEREFPASNVGGRKYWHVLGGRFEENKEKYQTAIDDERKLFYVALTRAKRRLYLTYELSTQPVSRFVVEAAASASLHINKEDLHRNQQDSLTMTETTDCTETSGVQEEAARREETRRQRQAYWDMVRYAKSQLYDYYGTASHFCPAARADLVRIKSMSPDEILQEASQYGLI